MSKINESFMPRLLDTSTKSRDGSAYMSGQRAFLNDVPLSACPLPQNSRSRIDWRSGWLSRNMAANPNFVEIAGTLKQGEKGIKYKYSTV